MVLQHNPTPQPKQGGTKMKKRVFMAITLSALMVAWGMTPATSMARTEFVSIGGGPTGGTFNYFANAISLHVPKAVPGVRMSSEGSGGSAENVRRVHSGDFDFGISYAVDIQLAAMGELPEDTRVYDKVRCIGYLYGAPAQMVVNAAGPLQSAKDLEGKRIAVGNAGSGAAASAERFFRHVGVWDKMRPEFLGYSPAAAAFKDGKIDGFWVLVGYPNASIIEASTQTGIRLMNLGKDAEESEFYKAYAYAPAVIPANTYSGQTEDTDTFEDGTLLITRADVSEDVVYEITKAIWSEEGLVSLRQAHNAARATSLENNFKGASSPLHKGAYKFWVEQGFDVPEHLKPID
jgi:uncharacterized protein